MNARFVPATGWAFLLAWYDPLVAHCTRENFFKAHLLSEAKLSPGARVLDVGCGSGTLALAAIAQQPTAQVIGLDADWRMLAQARKKTSAERVQWQIGDAIQLEFPDGAFDCVFCSLLFHHLRPCEKKLALAEVLRVLAPQGRFYYADYCQPSSQFAGLQFLPVRMLDGWQRTTCNVRGRVPALIEQAGFADVRETLVASSLLGTIRCFRAAKQAT